MKKHEARSVIDQALEELAKALEQGKSEQLMAHLSAMARFHRYSWHNTFLIIAQRPDATQVAGFNTWKSLGRHVRKGEKGILIIAPMRFKSSSDRDNGNSHQDEENSEGHLCFRAVFVFDISQTDGAPLPEIDQIQGDPGPHTERLTLHIAQRGIVLEERADLGGPEGLSTGGKILFKADLPPAEKFSVLVHELAHEMLHHDKSRDRQTKAVRETEAEAVAYVVSSAIGLTPKNASSDYIQLYQGDVKLLSASLGRIQATAGEILEVVLPSTRVPATAGT